MTQRLRSILFVAAVAMFVLLAGLIWLRTLSQTSMSWSIPAAAPTHPLDAPLDKAAALLPTAGRVSYLTDRDFNDARGDLARFYRAQWQLAPLVLDQHDGNDWTLADFADAASLESLLSGGRWQLIENVGDGMAVLRRVEDLP